MVAPVAVLMNLHPTMNCDGDDIMEAFKKFKQETQLAFKSFLKGTTTDEMVSYILLWTGEKGLDLFNSWDTSESDCNNSDTLLEKFERHLEPRSNHRIHRYEFQGLKQDPQKTIDNFLSRQKNVAEKCRFKDKDERIVDQLIWRCAHKEIQKSLIGKDALQLIEAVDTGRAFEATTKQMASLYKQTQ
uniref:Retrotransposon gag domain-containing protein n=1 Tax=Octopus bimaculoides TaxID=37653 RepID=A0A0L8GNW8_OCTBM